MPTYEYKCKACGFRFEKFQSIKDEALQICPSCGGELQRLLSGGVGLIFKGSGFYITDYSRKNSVSNGTSSSTKSSGSEAGEGGSAKKEKSKNSEK